MPKDALDHERISALDVKQRAATVPRVVEPDPRNLRAITQQPECFGDIALMQARRLCW